MRRQTEQGHTHLSRPQGRPEEAKGLAAPSHEGLYRSNHQVQTGSPKETGGKLRPMCSQAHPGGVGDSHLS